MSLKQIARTLRHKQTEEEKELWRALRGWRFAGFKFRRQHPIGNYVLDFYCADARSGIELDGSQHGLESGTLRDEHREKKFGAARHRNDTLLESSMATKSGRLPVGNLAGGATA